MERVAILALAGNECCRYRADRSPAMVRLLTSVQNCLLFSPTGSLLFTCLCDCSTLTAFCSGCHQVHHPGDGRREGIPLLPRIPAHHRVSDDLLDRGPHRDHPLLLREQRVLHRLRPNSAAYGKPDCHPYPVL